MLLVALFAAQAGAGAQSSMLAGSRVRVAAPSFGPAIQGSLMSVTSDSIAVAVIVSGARLDTTGAVIRRAIPRSAVTRLDVRSARTSAIGARRGAKAVFLVGATLTAVAVGHEIVNAKNNDDFFCPSREDKILCAGAFGGILTGIGAGFGAIVGAVMKGDQWTRVERPR